MVYSEIDGRLYALLIAAGSANLRLHAQEVNDLNVFPIPDGDTGDNMFMTMQGGNNAKQQETSELELSSGNIAKGMLLGARGNSGVILSQFFAGLAEGFKGKKTVGVEDLSNAFQKGVEHAYASVVTPTEGTILTVMKEATKFAREQNDGTFDGFFKTFLAEAHRSLQRTPELLKVLKEAGVIDSGAAGFIYIIEGMYAYMRGEAPEIINTEASTQAKTGINPDLFTEDSVLEFGYCTELLLRLQTIKTDVKNFDASVIVSYLNTIGNSIVCVKNDSIVKIHVHTMEPYKVLQFCQKFGEFLTVKIENMMIQHNEVEENKAKKKPRSKFAVVTVASGEGICNTFKEMGADYIIYGGQTMNPSSEDFIKAFDEVNAGVVYVLPNNSNIFLAAKQASEMYDDSDVRVIPTKTIGDAFAILSMLDYSSENADAIEEDMKNNMQGIVTAEISKSIRSSVLGGVSINNGDYLGFVGKTVLSTKPERKEVVLESVEKMNPDDHGVLLVIHGKESNNEETTQIIDRINQKHPDLETICIDGGQDVYDYILVAE